MSSRLTYIQKHCLILKLELFFRTSSAPNELLWNRYITAKLGEICKILYAKPTFSHLPNTLVSKRSRIDLVLSSSNVDQLLTVLFNLRGIEMGSFRTPGRTSSPISELFTLEDRNDDLKNLHSSLLREWKVLNHRAACNRNEIQPLVKFSPMIFNSKPAQSIYINEDVHVSFAEREQLPPEYDMSAHHGSRFFNVDRFSLPAGNNRVEKRRENKENASFGDDENAREFYAFINRYQRGHSSDYVAITSKLYLRFDSLPYGLQKWLLGTCSDSGTLQKGQKDTSEKVDLLLHGFRGFN